MIRFSNAFVKLTAWLPQRIVFRTKVYYEDKSAQSRRIKGAAMLVSNHTSIYDYAAMIFVFFSRTLRYQMAEVLFRKNMVLGTFLRMMGGIYVDRDALNFSFVRRSVEVLDSGGVVGMFPESRLPKPGETPLLPFTPSMTYIALESGAPIIPVYTNGKYFTKARARVIIGKPILLRELWDDALDEKTNIDRLTGLVRQKVTELGEELRRKEEG